MSELIAEARVLVTPDTTTFRALLTTQLAAASQGVTVPVQVTPVVTGTTAGSQAAALAGAQARVAATKQLTAAAATAAPVQERLARASDILAVAERRATAATSEVAAATTRYSATIRATTTTFQAYQAALNTTDLLLIKQTRDSYAAAKGNEALALSNLQAARTAQTQQAALASSTAATTRSLSGLSSGAASAGLSLAGLRGATLAANAPFLAGAAGAIAFGKAIQIATSFNSEIAVLGATTGATGEQLTQAAEAAREFGRDITLPGVTAGDAAKTITEFSKAGLSLNDSIAATRGGLQLAQAAQLSYTDAVTLSANALNAFNLSGNQAVKVADTLANAANLAQGGIEDTALALRQAAGAAAVVGVSFEDTTALLTLLARNGLTGSDAGTALRTAFLRLVNPSKQAQKVLASLNVELRDMQGNVRPEVFAEFAAAQRDLSAAQQQANAAIVFGQDAFRAFGFLGREGRAGLDEVRAGLDQTGTAARIAQARMTGLAGAQENLSNQLSSLGETIGQIALPPLTLFVNQIARLVENGNEAVQVVVDFGKALGDIEFPERPPGVDSAFGFFGDVLGKTNPITGVTSPIGQIKLLGDLFGDESEKTAEEIRNGGVELRSGIEDASREASRGAVSFGQQITSQLDAAFELVRKKAGEIRGLQFDAVARGQGQSAGLEELFDQLIAGGASPQEQIASLRRRAQVQSNIIASAGTDAQGNLLKARREAQARLASINTQITAIEQQIANDQRQARDEQRRIREQARREEDQEFLQRQQDARTQAEQRITVAESTPQLQDDIRRQVAFRALIQAQIQALRASAVDEKTKQDALRALRAAVFATTQEIKALKAAQAEQRAENQRAAAEERTENLALRTQIAEARGNDAAVIQALDAQIADAKKAQARAKTGTQEWLKATLALEQLREKKRDLLKGMEEDTGGGKSLAQFLTENTDLFERTASNIGTVGVDPLSGFDFSKSIVATTQRLQEAAKVQQAREVPSNRIPDAIDRLIAALDRNTEVTSGNSGSGGGFNAQYQAKVTGMRGQAMADFWQAQQARTMEQARFDGGGGV